MVEALSKSATSGLQSIVELDFECGDDLVRATGKLDRLCTEISSLPEPRVAIVRLQPDSTASFADTRPTTNAVGRWERAVRRFERLDAVGITVAHGVCGGISLDLLLVADCRIASQDFHLKLPRCEGQFWPGMAMYRLAQQVGLAQARRIVLQEQQIDRSRCIDLGLVDPSGSDIVTALAEQLAELTDVSISDFAIRRRLLLEATSTSYEDALGTHLAACDRTLRRTTTNDHDRPV
ncbi:(3,5-dihydroxycyclohex-3-enyl)acetyl-CoA dehydratase subunit B [Rhizobium sp. PP-F2F-G36]|nr:(3,5-dihydroxycyclohex-3-enyl)acetyl-CoA dehydratase subunit B [Rhizobium sp. PP-F2F-G36]